MLSIFLFLKLTLELIDLFQEDCVWTVQRIVSMDSYRSGRHTFISTFQQSMFLVSLEFAVFGNGIYCLI